MIQFHPRPEQSQSRMTQNFKLRPANRSDATEIGTLFALSCAKAYTSILPETYMSRYTPDNQLERWTKHLRDLPADHMIIVAASPSESPLHHLFGFIEVGPSVGSSSQDYVGEIHFLFVHPDSSRLGVGTALINCGEQWLREKGFRDGLLWVFCDNQIAIRFYKNQGWQEEGAPQKEPECLKGGYEVMECKLRKNLCADITEFSEV